ncbi:MAG: hypothetical protein H6845_01125 [Alphaproteobacteria bacterium]|nr:MAG: hypothetical protein H6845_01125 [Alphaproteobacteria bacterium]
MSSKFKIIGNGAFGRALSYSLLKHGCLIDEVDYRYIIPAVPSYAVVDVLSDYCLDGRTVIFVSKGLMSDGRLLGEWANENNIDWAVLAGPHFASEIIQGLDTFSVCGYEKEIKELKNVKNLNITFLKDKLAIQLLGVLKNIYAYFFGILHALNVGKNFTSAFFLMIIQEIMNIFSDLRFERDTIFSHAGLSDLFLTCTSYESRNFQSGCNLIQDKEDIALVESKHSIVLFEGRTNGKYPICHFLYQVSQNLSKDIKSSLYNLAGKLNV